MTELEQASRRIFAAVREQNFEELSAALEERATVLHHLPHRKRIKKFICDENHRFLGQALDAVMPDHFSSTQSFMLQLSQHWAGLNQMNQGSGLKSVMP